MAPRGLFLWPADIRRAR